MRNIQVEITIGSAGAVENFGRTEVAAQINIWLESITRLAGGCTHMQVEGTYIMSDLKFVKEVSHVFKVIVRYDVNQAKVIAELKDLASDMCREWGEECVLFTTQQLEEARFIDAY